MFMCVDLCVYVRMQVCLRTLNSVARLDTCVTVMDASTFWDNLQSIEELKDRCVTAHCTCPRLRSKQACVALGI